jgi:hypothetical protein
MTAGAMAFFFSPAEMAYAQSAPGTMTSDMDKAQNAKSKFEDMTAFPFINSICLVE